MRKMIFFAIFVIACVVNTTAQQVEVVNQDLLDLDTKLVELVKAEDVSRESIDEFWFKTDNCWTKFSWNGAILSVMDVNVTSTKDSSPISEDYFTYAIDIDSGNIITTTTPSVYVETYSARTDWKNEKEYSEYWVLGGAEYKKKSTHYSDMAIGEIETEKDTFLYDYDLLIEKNKISLKILSFSISNPEQKRIIYEREFIAD